MTDRGRKYIMGRDKITHTHTHTHTHTIKQFKAASLKLFF